MATAAPRAACGQLFTAVRPKRQSAPRITAITAGFTPDSRGASWGVAP